MNTYLGPLLYACPDCGASLELWTVTVSNCVGLPTTADPFAVRYARCPKCGYRARVVDGDAIMVGWGAA